MTQAAGVHEPGKILLNPALAVGGDCLSDIGMLRAEPGLFGLVTSDPTVSRLVEAVAGASPRALTAIRRARAEVRQRVGKLAGADAPALTDRSSWTSTECWSWRAPTKRTRP